MYMYLGNDYYKMLTTVYEYLFIMCLLLLYVRCLVIRCLTKKSCMKTWDVFGLYSQMHFMCIICVSHVYHILYDIIFAFCTTLKLIFGPYLLHYVFYIWSMQWSTHRAPMEQILWYKYNHI